MTTQNEDQKKQNPGERTLFCSVGSCEEWRREKIWDGAGWRYAATQRCRESERRKKVNAATPRTKAQKRAQSVFVCVCGAVHNREMGIPNKSEPE